MRRLLNALEVVVLVMASPAIADGPGAMPEAEQKVCRVLNEYAARYKEARAAQANELKLSKLRGERGRALKAALAGGKVVGWFATVESLKTNSDGKAILALKLPCTGHAKTWNNAISDGGDRTLIPQASRLYDAIAELQHGAQVTFGGVFIAAPNEADLFREMSIGERGSMLDPEFIVRFTAIQKR